MRRCAPDGALLGVDTGGQMNLTLPMRAGAPACDPLGLSGVFGGVIAGKRRGHGITDGEIYL